jgi:hypothetical protein
MLQHYSCRILMRYDVITDGGLQQNDLGYTMVHEIGQ